MSALLGGITIRPWSGRTLIRRGEKPPCWRRGDAGGGQAAKQSLSPRPREPDVVHSAEQHVPPIGVGGIARRNPAAPRERPARTLGEVATVLLPLCSYVMSNTGLRDRRSDVRRADLPGL